MKPSQPIEPDVEREMRVRLIVVPDHGFEPTMTEEQLNQYDEKMRPVIFAINRVASAVQFYADALVEMNSQVREIEADRIRFLKRVAWGMWWVFGAIFVAMMSALAFVVMHVK